MVFIYIWCHWGLFGRDPKEKKKEVKLAKKRNSCAPACGHFWLLYTQSFPFSFLLILGRRHFGELGRKHPASTTFFLFFSSISPNIKIFSPLFSHQFFIFPKIPPNKHTLKLARLPTLAKFSI